MTPDKRKKIKALMDSPAASENEKEICRKLLAMNPELKPDPPINPFDPRTGEKTQGARWYEEALRNAKRQQTPRTQESQDFWSRAFGDDAAGRAAAARGQQYRQPFPQDMDDAERQAAAAQQQQAARQSRWQEFKGQVNNPEYQRAQRSTNKFFQELVRLMAEERDRNK